MSHIFISHASEDKVERVKPLVEVLVAEGENVWIDRPGVGSGNFGFDQSYIAINAIDYLNSGQSWSGSIQSALASSGAVLACLSRAVTACRTVILQEMTVAAAMGKLVTCIVDDMSFGDLSSFSMGMLDMDRVQSPAINPSVLRNAIDLRRGQGLMVEELPEPLRIEWEKVRNLVGSINRVRKTPRPLRQQDFERLTPRLARMPIGPVLHIHKIPPELIGFLAEQLSTAESMFAAVDQSNALLAKATDDATLASEIQLSRAFLLTPGVVPALQFWSGAFTRAGLLSRRTVAALLMSPIAEWAARAANRTQISNRFLDELEANTI